MAVQSTSQSTNRSTHQSTKPNFLRRVLQANGIFSGLCGIFFIVGSGPLASFLCLDAPVILIVAGVILVLYGITLFQTAARESIIRQMAITAVVLDVAWVVGSIAILVTGWPALTTGGKWAVAIVADIVAVFALLQYFALRRK